MAVQVTFHGPNSEWIVKAIDANGKEFARYVMLSGDQEDFKVYKLDPKVFICTAATASESTSMTFYVLDTRFELKERLETVTAWETPWGNMRWKQESMSSSRELKLLDETGNVIAKANTEDDVKMEVLVKGNDKILDSMLAGWVALIYRTVKEREIEKAGQGEVGTLAGGKGT